MGQPAAQPALGRGCLGARLPAAGVGLTPRAAVEGSLGFGGRATASEPHESTVATGQAQLLRPDSAACPGPTSTAFPFLTDDLALTLHCKYRSAGDDIRSSDDNSGSIDVVLVCSVQCFQP